MTASKETKPKKQPHWLNKRTMAESCGITVQGFDKWGIKPVARVGTQAFFVVSDVIENRVSKALEKHQPELISLITGTTEYEKYRLTKEQADAQELKNELARAKVVPIELFTAVLSSLGAEVGGILDTLPLQIKRKHPELDAGIIDDVKWQVVKAMNAMARLDSVIDQVVADYVDSIDPD